MKLRLVEDQFGRPDDPNEFEDEHKAQISNKARNAFTQIKKKCSNISFPDFEDDIKIIADKLESDALTSPVGRFLQIINSNVNKLKEKSGKVNIMSLFSNDGNRANWETNFESFSNDLEKNLGDIKTFIPYKNCFNLESRSRTYVCRVIDNWFSKNFDRYFGDIIASDTGAKGLENENRELKPEDFNNLFVLNKNELKKAGYPGENKDTRTIYGTIEYLTKLNKAELPGNRNEKTAQVNINKFRRSLEDMTVNGKKLEKGFVDSIMSEIT